MPPVSSSFTACSITTARAGAADSADSVLLYAWVSTPLVSTMMMWFFGMLGKTLFTPATAPW